jgi:alpha/beta superfamily hydrolase
LAPNISELFLIFSSHACMAMAMANERETDIRDIIRMPSCNLFKISLPNCRIRICFALRTAAAVDDPVSSLSRLDLESLGCVLLLSFVLFHVNILCEN